MERFLLEESLNKSIEYPAVEEVLSVGYYSILLFLATCGNIFIIYATLKVRARSHDAMTILLIRVLATNDLIGGLILYPNFILLLSKGYFPFNATYCIILGIFEIYCPLCSTLLVMTLVLTKVAMIRNPFLSMGNAKKIYLILPPLFLVGLIAPLGVFVELGHYMFSPERGTCTYQFYPKLLKEKVFIMTCTTLFVILPLCVITCMSVYILRFMRKMRNKSQTALHKDNRAYRKTKLSQRPKDKKFQVFKVSHSVYVLLACVMCIVSTANAVIFQDMGKFEVQRATEKIMKSVIVVLLVVIAYIICWSMFFCVTTVAFLIGGEETIPRQVLLWQKALLMTNNAVNPIVYVCGNKKLQLVLQNLIYRIRGMKGVAKDLGFSTILNEGGAKPTFTHLTSRTTGTELRFTPDLGSRRTTTSVFSSTSRISRQCETAPGSVCPVGRARRRQRRCMVRPSQCRLSEKESEKSESDVVVEACAVVMEKESEGVINDCDTSCDQVPEDTPITVESGLETDGTCGDVNDYCNEDPPFSSPKKGEALVVVRDSVVCLPEINQISDEKFSGCSEKYPTENFDLKKTILINHAPVLVTEKPGAIEDVKAIL